MFSSNPENIPRVLKLIWIINTHDPLKRIFDVRIGWGKYALLIRERHEYDSLSENRKDWKIVIDGIDNRSLYVNSHTARLYNTVYIAPVDEWAQQYKGMEYDVIVWDGGIEYMHAIAVQKTVNNLLDFCKWLIIVTPNPKMQPFNVMNHVNISDQSLGWNDHSKVALLNGVVPANIKKEDVLAQL